MNTSDEGVKDALASSFYNIEFIKSLEDFLEKHKKRKGIYWFRGHEDKNYLLIPSVYRKSPTICCVKQCEDRFIANFSARTLHLLRDQRPVNSMEWLSIMQHYRLSTRLLDWTERAETAILFAVEKYFIDKDHDRSKIPCVWVLDPLELNKYYGLNQIPNLSLMAERKWRRESFIRNRFINTAIEDSPSEDSSVKHMTLEEVFFKGIDGCKSDCTPIAVFHPLNNERIRAQSGVFTLFPLYKSGEKCFYPDVSCQDAPARKEINRRHVAMEELEYCHRCLTKYIITHPEQIYKDLVAMGLKRSVIYPEIDVISTEIEEYELQGITPPKIK